MILFSKFHSAFWPPKAAQIYERQSYDSFSSAYNFLPLHIRWLLHTLCPVYSWCWYSIYWCRRTVRSVWVKLKLDVVLFFLFIIYGFSSSPFKTKQKNFRCIFSQIVVCLAYLPLLVVLVWNISIPPIFKKKTKTQRTFYFLQ